MCTNSACKCSSIDTLIAFPELAEESTPFRSMTCLLTCDITASVSAVDLRRISYPSRCTSDHSTELNNQLISIFRGTSATNYFSSNRKRKKKNRGRRYNRVESEKNKVHKQSSEHAQTEQSIHACSWSFSNESQSMNLQTTISLSNSSVIYGNMDEVSAFMCVRTQTWLYAPLGLSTKSVDFSCSCSRPHFHEKESEVENERCSVLWTEADIED